MIEIKKECLRNYTKRKDVGKKKKNKVKNREEDMFSKGNNY